MVKFMVLWISGPRIPFRQVRWTAVRGSRRPETQHSLLTQLSMAAGKNNSDYNNRIPISSPLAM
jgi:hypothetical protein